MVDPFSDIYLAQVVPLMAMGGRYVTCGMEDQSSVYTGVNRDRSGNSGSIMGHVMLKNLCIMGNCLGLSEDLQSALDEHVAGRFPVLVDSVFWDNPAGFLERTYLAADRFGKVVFAYA